MCVTSDGESEVKIFDALVGVCCNLKNLQTWVYVHMNDNLVWPTETSSNNNKEWAMVHLEKICDIRNF